MVKRVNIWNCDFCGREEIRSGYGLPAAGWVYLSGKHKCDQCSTEEEKKKFDKLNETAILKPVIAKYDN